jgi:hypothetical protein
VSLDVGTFIEILLVIFLLTSFGGLKYSSDASDERKKVLRILAVCSAVFIATGFDTLSRLWSPRAEVTGVVVESYTSRGRADTSYFRVQPSSGPPVRLDTVRDLAISIDNTETVDVIYEVWTSHPLKINIISGDRRGIILSRDHGDRVSAVEVSLMILFLALSVLNVSKLRKLPANA